MTLKTNSIRVIIMAIGITFLTVIGSCTIDPPLNLAPDQEEIETDYSFGKISLELDLLWNYDVQYDWRDQWFYEWDSIDNSIFGYWTLVEPNVFNLRRYYTGKEYYGNVIQTNKHQIEGNVLTAHYNIGYYDILAWNEVYTLDGIQSIHIDESNPDSVKAYTNPSLTRTRHSRRYAYAFYQPEFLFSGFYENLLVTRNPEDYDFYDDENNCYYKTIDMVLEPRTYIYLTQIILHHNNGRVENVEGSATLTGLAKEVNLNNGITGDESISVTYFVRLKKGCNMNGEDVDIIGGRVFTFGICNMNPTRATRSSLENEGDNKYIDLTMIFNNGNDSTYTFDVTDQVNERYKGGVITIELDVDTLKLPNSKGSGFNAIVVGPEDGGTTEWEL